MILNDADFEVYVRELQITPGHRYDLIVACFAYLFQEIRELRADLRAVTRVLEANDLREG